MTVLTLMDFTHLYISNPGGEISCERASIAFWKLCAHPIFCGTI